MRKSLNIAFVYIGLVIGAGFASGREIFEYFNLSSRTDFTGIIFAALGFALLAYITMDLSHRLSAASFDEFIEKTAPRLAGPIKLFMLGFMFCGFFVMMSACGVLFEETFSLSPKWGSIALAAVCFVIFSFDVKGLVTVNVILVPVMIAGMLFLSLSSIVFGSSPVFASFDAFKHNFIVSAVCYVSYNTITAGAVLVPLAANTEKRDLFRSVVFAGVTLGALIFFVWSALNIYYDGIYASELPTMTLAEIYGSVGTFAYTAVMFMALCTTAVSHGFGILSKFRLTGFCDRMLAAALLCLAALPFARLGFSGLVANLYSVFGYIGLLWTGIVVYRYFKG